MIKHTYTCTIPTPPPPPPPTHTYPCTSAEQTILVGQYAYNVDNLFTTISLLLQTSQACVARRNTECRNLTNNVSAEVSGMVSVDYMYATYALGFSLFILVIIQACFCFFSRRRSHQVQLNSPSHLSKNGKEYGYFEGLLLPTLF